jgi:hypothetical protein
MQLGAGKRDKPKGDRQALSGKKAHVKAARFVPVKDSRKRKVRGIVQRNGKYDVQMKVSLPSTPR